MAEAINVPAPGKELTLSMDVDLSTLSAGFHMLVIRSCDESGKWGFPHQQIFYVFNACSVLPDIMVTSVEYYIDNDPGYGNGTIVNLVTPAKDVTVNFNVDLSNVESGDHILYIRAKDDTGQWGFNYMQAFSTIVTSRDKTEMKSWFKLYPNPNSGHFWLEFSEEQPEILKVSISNINGQIVYMNNEIDAKSKLEISLAKGLYFISIESKDKTFTHKIIIE
jgi:hypothetical protein